LGAATELKPGETSNVKLILFSNPNRLRFNFMTNSYISTPENTIGNFIAAIELGDVDLAIKEMDDYAVKKYGSAFNLLVFDNPGFIKDFANKTLVKITDVMAKYELKVLENGVEIIYDVYLYKNSKGEWKIYKM
jgi:ABC-type transporter MlaC component